MPKKLKFKKGALKAQLGVAPADTIPKSKFAAALSGSLGPLAKKRAQFKNNVLTGAKN